MRVGIDASNLLQGGGQTHLVELLAASDPERDGFSKVIIWGAARTLKRLPKRPWLECRTAPALEARLVRRTIWQSVTLAKEAQQRGCDILFVPGGSYIGAFRPFVTMSQNMLPFEFAELRRYKITAKSARLLMLRLAQSFTFTRADGLIFLSDHARAVVEKSIICSLPPTRKVPHGVNDRFIRSPRPVRDIVTLTSADPLRIIYVSVVAPYKHQWNVVEAIAGLRRRTGWPLALDLIGPAEAASLARMQEAIARVDPTGEWTTYHGEIKYEELDRLYVQADAAVFASTCENMPNILLECMAAGLPVACSNRGPMPEVLSDAGLYFDPEVPETIAVTLEELIAFPELRGALAHRAYQRATTYTWDRCAKDTFGFFSQILEAGVRS